MAALVGLVFIIMVSLLVVRLGANALILTGMSVESAKFQASSAFFGVGFTTHEAEQVVEHPIRRRIIKWLIIGGNIGLTSALATLIVTFISARDAEESLKGVALIATLLVSGVAVALVANLKLVTKPVDFMLRWILTRSGVQQVYNYDLLLKVEEGYCVSDFKVESQHRLAGRALKESRPSDQGIIVLNVHRRDGTFVGAPDKDFVVEAGDLLMIYGHEKDLAEACHSWNLDPNAPCD